MMENETSATLLVQVMTPEKGVYATRADGTLARALLAAKNRCVRSRVVASFDWGIDVGVVVSTTIYDLYDSSMHLPSFRVERLFNADDRHAEMANEPPAKMMANAFQARLRQDGMEVRIVHARLSLECKRFFVRYVCDAGRLNVSRVVAEIGRTYGVMVNAWQFGPRDLVGFLGSVGPCGQPCCCSNWQHRYPTRIVAPKNVSPALSNGICGRWKCCLAFEEVASSAPDTDEFLINDKGE